MSPVLRIVEGEVPETSEVSRIRFVSQAEARGQRQWT